VSFLVIGIMRAYHHTLMAEYLNERGAGSPVAAIV
jgi:hypothetical protein